MSSKKFSISLSLSFFLVITLLSIFSPKIIIRTKAIDVTPETRIEKHDLVLVNYTLYIVNQIEDNQEGVVYVEDPEVIKRDNLPQNIREEFPDTEIWAPPNIGFMEGMLGMKTGEEKTHIIGENSGKGFTNITDEHYGKELVYVIRIKEILYDSSSSPPSLLDFPLFIPIVILIVLIISLLIIIRIHRYSVTHDIFGLKKRCYICGKIAEVLCGNSGCNTSFCKECFNKNNKCDKCGSNTMVPIK